ncbi:SPOSA6832_01981 [Sporobolomyces salmonicolor]|uniref:DNA polymerase epsilon subunit D n=1 Tax=Sporidiobolus salmonicolor TaxID=5005 RepID=A0A0D6EK15_SPOSA|nr:SPOSA6832_01981 [Sporobolomyces salmonicolor]
MPRKKAVPAAADPASATGADGEDGQGIDSFELPKSVVARLAKAAVPPEVKLQKEVPLALVKGSTVFINYLAALSHDVATERNHKTIAATHVLDAVKQLGWDDGGELSKTLKQELAAFREANEARKQGRAPAAPAPKPVPKSNPAASPIPADHGDASITQPQDDRLNADKANAEGSGAEDDEDVEEYVEEDEEDDALSEGGSEGLEEEEVADRRLEEGED